MKKWMQSKQTEYTAARPKEAFADAHIIEFLEAFPNLVPGIDWSQKNAWTWDTMQTILSDQQRTGFAIWRSVRDHSSLSCGPTNSA
jgi:hypothetical protein